MQRGMVGLLAMGLAFAALGCGSASDKPEVPKELNARGSLHLAVIPKGTTHEFWKSIHAGAIKAQRELEAQGVPVRITWKGPIREDDREQQIQVVEGFLSQGVNGIVLAPLDASALVRPVQEAQRAQVRHQAPLVKVAERGREDTEVAVAGRPHRRPVELPVLMRDLGSDRGVHGERDAALPGSRHQALARMGDGRDPAREPAAERLAASQALGVTLGHRLGHPRPGLVGQPERAVGEVLRDILGGLAEAGDLEIVDRGRAVERQMGDPTPLERVGEERGAAGLDDVTAAHDDDGPTSVHGFGPAVDDRAQVRGRQDVGQRADQRLDGRRAVQHLAELGDRHLVAAMGKRERRDGGEIRRWIA